MFGRNKKINDKLDLILDKLSWLNIRGINNTLNQNSKDIMNIYKKMEKLEENIAEASEIVQTEADFMKKLSEIFASVTPPATIAEAEERMQILSDKIDKLEEEKRTLASKVGGLTSGNSKLKKKNKALALDKRKLLKDLEIYQKNNGYIPKKVRPTKPKIQKLKETVKPISIIK